MKVVPQPGDLPIRMPATPVECTHPDWHLNFLPGAGVPIPGGPFGARRLWPICTECGEPVQVGASISIAALRREVDPDEETRCVDCGVEVDGLGPPICRECADVDD